MREQRRHLEELFQRFGSDHAALAEQRIDDAVACRKRTGVRGRGPRARPRTAGLDRHNRFVAADAAGDFSKTAWIAEALEVEKDHPGSRIRFPILEQVVRGHVRLVADRRERGQPEVEMLRLFENRQSERAALTRECNRAGWREYW